MGTLADKIDAIARKVQVSDSLLESTEGFGEVIRAGESSLIEKSYADIMSLGTMVEDFQYVRETLKEVTENARRVQNAVTLELLEENGDKRASLIVSFAELSKAITDAQKLYVDSYKQMSTTLLNLDKIKQNERDALVTHGDNHLHIHGGAGSVSTADLLQNMKKEAQNE